MIIPLMTATPRSTALPLGRQFGSLQEHYIPIKAWGIVIE